MAEAYFFLGDSFVKRLYRDKKAQGTPFLVGRKVVKMWGWSGADVSTVQQRSVDTIRRWARAVVVIQLGSNDLCDSARSPEHVVEDLLDYASFLVERRGVNRVVVCQILRRNSAVHLRSQTHQPEHYTLFQRLRATTAHPTCRLGYLISWLPAMENKDYYQSADDR